MRLIDSNSQSQDLSNEIEKLANLIEKTKSDTKKVDKIIEGIKNKLNAKFLLAGRNVNNSMENFIIKKILEKIEYLKKKNGKYIGFLYAGLMIKKDEPYLIEYNVRMGDPECQTILPLLNNDFAEVVENCLNGTLDKIKLDWKIKKSICVVLSSKGYPNKFKKNILIKNLENFEDDKNKYIFHAGTKFSNEEFFSNGGRVLNFVTIDSNFKSAKSCSFSTKVVLVEFFPNHVVLQRSKSEFYISLTTLYLFLIG